MTKLLITNNEKVKKHLIYSETRPGESRKLIIDYSDEEITRKAIEQIRQNLSKPREA